MAHVVRLPLAGGKRTKPADDDLAREDVDAGDTNGRAKRWCFTLFYPQRLLPSGSTDATFPLMYEALHRALREEFDGGPHFQGMLYQIEKSPSTGRPHAQGYLMFTDTVRFQSVKACFARSAIAGAEPLFPSLKVCRGDHQSNVAYCSKTHNKDTGTEARWKMDEDPTIIGQLEATPPGPVPRSSEKVDHMTVVGNIIARCKELNISPQKYEKDESLSREERGCLVLYMDRMMTAWIRHVLSLPCVVKPVNAWFLWGPPGTGKTSFVDERHGSECFVLGQEMSHSHGFWFNGITTDTKGMCFDDIDSKWFSAGPLRGLLDGRRTMCPTKGGAVPVQLEYAYFTSNKTWEELWVNEKGEPTCDEAVRKAFESRIPPTKRLPIAGQDYRQSAHVYVLPPPAAGKADRVLPSAFDILGPHSA